MIDGRNWEIAGWDLWESELEPRLDCRGWFEQRDPEFAAKPGDELRLLLDSSCGARIERHVVVTVIDREERL